MPDTPMTETEKAVARLISALQSLSVSTKAATDAYLAATEGARRLIPHGIAMLEAENEALRLQRRELRTEIKRLSALAGARPDAKAFRFVVGHGGDKAAGFRPYSDEIVVTIASGDPGGEAGEFEEVMQEHIANWYDGATVVIEK